jgi:hypothetical protein
MQNFLTNNLFSGKDMAMLEGIGNAVGNKIGEVVPPLWNAYAPEAAKVPVAAALNKFGKLKAIPEYATTRAAELFPGDDGKQNAMRHSLWMGKTAQELGGGMGAGIAAKLAGYGFEGLTAAPLAAWELMKGNPKGASAIVADSRQDLNNNAVGINNARYTKDPQQLENDLKGLANRAVEASPAFSQPSRPYLTQAVKRTKQ